MKVNTFLWSRFPQTYPVGTYAPFRSCGDTRKPDAVVVLGDLMVVVETDEDCHAEYELSCEWAKALQHGQSALMTEGVGGLTVRCAMKLRLEELGGLIGIWVEPVATIASLRGTLRLPIFGPREQGFDTSSVLQSDDIGSQEGWGTEWAAALNIGIKRDQRSKAIRDKVGLLTLLRDIHCRLISQIPATVNDRDRLAHRLHVSGAILDNWTVVHIALYVGGGYYAAKEMARAQLPRQVDGNFGRFFARTVKCFLQFRDGVSWSRDLFLEALNDGDPGTSDDEAKSVDSAKATKHEVHLFPRTPKKGSEKRTGQWSAQLV
ncbi:hypothetical protein HDU87_008335 [Geranomyces variabilis]|uniref:Uncharacterized protein n=1 Tax=Geranomyces variabilis TaxID=109894 RepID=A0AAD5TIE7_9FUNG|nr:hypothetical protein HDU87_008335 [Geranomyces variabilis]